MSRALLVSDTALNDSNKTLTPPPGGAARLRSLRVEFTATGTATNRTLFVRYRDSSGDVVWATELATAITPSDVMIVNFSPNAPTVAPVDTGIEGSQHIADVLFHGDWDVQVIDTGAVDAAADDMILHSVWSHE